MTYSPYFGPVLMVVLVVSSLPTAWRHTRARNPSVGKGTFFAIALASVVAGVGQAALNHWVNWLGDGLFAATVAGFLFFTRDASARTPRSRTRSNGS